MWCLCAFLLALSPWVFRGASSRTVYPRATNTNISAIFDHAGQIWDQGTEIAIAGSEAFDNVTGRWTVYMPPTYQASISPSTEEDVVRSVKLATKFGVPFLATNGRHGYSTTLANMQGGIEIDLSQFNTVDINKEAATLTIGGGVRFRDIFDLVYEAGFQIQTGTCSCVGMVGATLGGGIGRLHGLNGMIIDALLSVRLVTADGNILDVSKTSHPELFWGLRGAGQNFGIVTSATYKLSPLYRDGVWTSADILLTPEKNVSYFEAVAKMHPLPPQLTVETIMNYNTTLNQPQLMLSVVYAGPKDEAERVMAPILDLGPSYSLLKELTWNQLSTQTTFLLDGPVCEDGQIYDIYPINLRSFDVPTLADSFQKMAAFWSNHTTARDSVIVLETWPNEATVAVPNNETAYPWRDTTTYVMVQMRWNTIGDPVVTPANKLGRELRSALSATSGYSGLAVYMNYAYGDEAPEAIYGAEKLARLLALKKQYDPQNAFRFYNPLPTQH